MHPSSNADKAINLTVLPFSMGTDKDMALKPLEEAAEAFGAWQNADRHHFAISSERENILYECCDTIQATCNLIGSLGYSNREVDEMMQKVTRHNIVRGRYDNDAD